MTVHMVKMFSLNPLWYLRELLDYSLSLSKTITSCTTELHDGNVWKYYYIVSCSGAKLPAEEEDAGTEYPVKPSMCGWVDALH